MKALLKRILPKGLIPILKMKLDVFYYAKLMRKIETAEQACSYIFGTPIHANLGDHLITLSERFFLDTIGYTDKIIEIPTEMYQVFKKRLIKAIPKESVIFINGGGWMGNLWPFEEQLLQDMAVSFQKNRIIIFPQTIYYDRAVQPYQTLMDRSVHALEVCEDLTLFVRDPQSYDFAVSHYKKASVRLVPDIALAYFDCVRRKNWADRKNAVGICLREDREACRDTQVEKTIRRLLKEREWDVEKIDTMSKRRVSQAKREKVVTRRLTQFSEKKMIVTDRLHGMIFAYLTGTPCMALDNKTKKVSGVYNEWFHDCGSILFVSEKTTEDELLAFLDKAGCGDLVVENRLYSKFECLKEIIRNG